MAGIDRIRAAIWHLKQAAQTLFVADLLAELDEIRRGNFDARRGFYSQLETLKHKHLNSRAARSTDYVLFVIKSCNLVSVEWEYKNRFTFLLSRPTNYLLDATNNCQLGCGNCQHTFDRNHAAAAFLPLKSGSMSRETHDAIVKHASNFAFAADYYNQSESLLNKLTPTFLREANRRRVITTVSSNFEMPKIDFDALIGSGLNFLDLSIDGATQETYEQYRRGGNLERVLQNARSLIKARGDHPTPHVRWKFLAFEHNAHEMEDALSIARSIGVDEIAFSPGMPGPGGQTAVGFDMDLVATKAAERFSDRTGLHFANNNDDVRQEVFDLAETSLVDRYDDFAMQDPTLDHKMDGDGWCDWLYYCPAFDANGKVRSCANPDYRDRGSLVYGDIVADGENYFNSARFREARRATVSRECILPNPVQGAASDSIGCRRCPMRPSPCSHLPNAAGWQMSLGKAVGRSNVSPQVIMEMAGWSQHSRHAER